MVSGSIPGGVTGEFFHGSHRRNHVPWGRLSPWKWLPVISHGVKAAGAYGWRTFTLVVPNVKKIRGLNLPGTPWATSVCRGMTFTLRHLSAYMQLPLLPKNYINVILYRRHYQAPRSSLSWLVFGSLQHRMMSHWLAVLKIFVIFLTTSRKSTE